MQHHNSFPQQQLINWFIAHARDLPWRINRTPYRVWISEIMLQQTQVKTVIPYYQQWMEFIPSVHKLAETPIEYIIKLWEGLGYYSRARNLKKAAIYLIENHQGSLPEDELSLQKIPGLGFYTTHAILSFAFKKKATPIDANVKRVLSRYFFLDENANPSYIKNKLRILHESILPDTQHDVFNEALIELGALVCLKKPLCSQCPLQYDCQAKQKELTSHNPTKKPKSTYTVLHRSVMVVQYQNSFLIEKKEEGKILGGLYEFPYLDHPDTAIPNQELVNWLVALNFSIITNKTLQRTQQAYTSFRITLYPFHFSVAQKIDLPGYEWLEKDLLPQKAFSSGHKRILSQVL